MDDFVIAASDEAKKLRNPIRSIVDDRKMSTNPEKEMLNLTVGKFSPEVGHVVRVCNLVVGGHYITSLVAIIFMTKY